MRNKSLLVFVITLMIIVILISGCKTKEKEPSSKVYMGGNDGVKVNFDLDLQHQENRYIAYSGDNFNMNVIVKNEGEADVNPGEVVIELKGIDPEDYGVATQITNTAKLDKKSMVEGQIIPGGDEQLSFGTAVVPDIQGTSQLNTIYLEYTYPYQTYITVKNVCFKGDPSNTRLCSFGDKDVESSSAPIQATTATDALVGGRKVQVLINVINAGGGDASVNRDSFSNYYDKVKVVNDHPDEWTCTPSELRIPKSGETKKATIRCTTTESLSKDTLMQKNLELRLQYYYRDFEITNLQIKKLTE